jgi:hypothetical protein
LYDTAVQTVLKPGRESQIDSKLTFFDRFTWTALAREQTSP